MDKLSNTKLLIENKLLIFGKIAKNLKISVRIPNKLYLKEDKVTISGKMVGIWIAFLNSSK